MKKLSLKECRKIAQGNQAIVPNDMKLWKKVKSVTESTDKNFLAQVYEKMGGKWKIVESSIPRKFPGESKFVDEHAGPLSGSKHEEAGRDWARRLREYDPITYHRFMNWD